MSTLIAPRLVGGMNAVWHNTHLLLIASFSIEIKVPFSFSFEAATLQF